MEKLRPSSHVGTVVLWDQTKVRHDFKDHDVYNLAGEIRRVSKSGDVFWFELLSEELEPLSLSIHLYVDEDSPDYSGRGYKRRGGTFLLNVPSGRLIAGGVEHWSGHEETEDSAKTEVTVPPGSYALTVREQEFDNLQHNAEMIDLLGEADWNFYNKVMWFRAGGCLPVLACIVLAFLREWQALLFFALPLAFSYWLVQAALWRFGRWARIDRAIKEHQSESPGIILELHAINDTSLLKGGSVRIR